MKGIAIAVLLVLAGGCKRDKAPSAEPRTESAVPSASAPDHEPHEELPRRIELSKKVMTDAKLQFAAVRREPLSETLSLPGEIAANPDQVAKAQAKPTLAGWFVGQVMKATGGKANPQAVQALVKAKLGLPDEA